MRIKGWIDTEPFTRRGYVARHAHSTFSDRQVIVEFHFEPNIFNNISVSYVCNRINRPQGVQ